VEFVRYSYQNEKIGRVSPIVITSILVYTGFSVYFIIALARAITADVRGVGYLHSRI